MNLTKVLVDGVPTWKLECPQCGLIGSLDDDQYHGRVSVDCPNENCTFHETHDFSQMTGE